MSMKKILVSMIAGVVMTTAFAISAMAAETLGGADFENNDGVVFDGTNYYVTLAQAVNGVHGTDDAVLYCKPGADLGTMTHGHVCKDLTVYGNGAYLSGGEKDFELDFPTASGSSCAGLTGDVTLTVDNLTGAGVWGSKTSAYEINLVFTDCNSMKKIFFNGTAGALNIDMEDCTFDENSESCAIYSNTFGEITLDNVDFIGVAQPVALSNESNGTQTIVLDGCDFEDCGAATQDWTVPVSIKSKNADGSSVLMVNNCTFTGTVTNSIGQDADILLDYGVGNTLANITNTNAKLGVETEKNTASYTEVAEDKEYVANNKTETASAPVVSADGIKYATLQAALNAATIDGNEVDLMGNTIMVKDEMADPINGRRYYDVMAKPVIVKNGTIDLTAAKVSDSVFRLENADDAITFKNVKFVQYEDAANSMTYFINIHTDGNVVEFIDCEFEIAKVSSVIANTSGGTVTVKNCVATVDSGNFLYRGGMMVENVTFTSETGRFLYANEFPTTIKNSNIVASEIVFINQTGTLAITDNTSIKVNKVYTRSSASGLTNLITVDDTSALRAETIELNLVDTENSEGTIVSKADSVEVKFVKVDAEEVNGEMVDTKEGEDLYNINLVGSFEEIINRLNSADLTFKLTSDHSMAYEIIASNDEVAINPVNNSDDRYEFHYNGKDGVKTDVAEVITIGQVKFTGYGAYTFVVDAEANETNIVHATTISDNKVDTFVPNDVADTQNGELVIIDKIDAYIAVPTRNLIINIDFPNAIEEKDIAYNDMKVVVYGGDLAAAITIDLGSDAIETDIDNNNDKETAKYFADFVDGKYVVTLTDILTVNNSYNVEVSGEGYRTARYTVTMNCDESKTLNFWNNVKDNTVNVEEGKDSSAKNITFLAGDIVKDTVINIYDLSAVVSYFGEINLSATNKPEYVKYDLNRDGKIDSKDVAYVLVSWGK